jgi:hypothetical protein
MKLLASSLCLLALVTPHATADDLSVNEVALLKAQNPPVEEETPEEKVYLPLSFSFPTIGLGMVMRGANEMDLGKRAFDGTFRWSPGWNVHERLRLGGFGELRTASFDTLEAALGPHVELAISELWAVQLRGGLGGGSDAGSYATAGVHAGLPFAGLSVTGRRYFDDDHVEVSINLEVAIATVLFFASDPFSPAGTNR